MITNVTKDRILCGKQKILTNPIHKAIGLMFSRRITDTGYIFVFSKSKKVDLHMFFVFYPIDVLFLNKNKKIIEIKEHFKPFTFYVSKKKATYVIELPKYTITHTDTAVGDVISFKEGSK